LAILIDCYKSPVHAVYVRAQHGQRFRQSYTQAQPPRVRIKNIHAALQSGERGRCRSQSGEERNINKRTTRVQLPPLWTVNGLCGFVVIPDGMPLNVICTSPENPFSDCTLTWIPEFVVP
jgi:hypothetical protein